MSTDAEQPPNPARRITRLDRWLGWGGAALVLLVVITLVVPNVLAKFFSTHSGGFCWKCLSDLRAIHTALDEYAVRNDGRYPHDLTALVTPDENGYRWLQTSRVPRDPWKHVYVPPPTPSDKPVVFCLGEDGIAGTDDDIRVDDPHDE